MGKSFIILGGILAESIILAFLIGWIYDVIRLQFFVHEKEDSLADYENIKAELDRKTQTKGVKIGKNAKVKPPGPPPTTKASKESPDDGSDTAKNILLRPGHGGTILK